MANYTITYRDMNVAALTIFLREVMSQMNCAAADYFTTDLRITNVAVEGKEL